MSEPLDLDADIRAARVHPGTDAERAGYWYRRFQDICNRWDDAANEAMSLRAELDAARAAIKMLEDQLLPDGA